ncbi:MAG: hypothetical protein ACREBV_10750, partial [Candidatus Zixiibacteriota bacterium]
PNDTTIVVSQLSEICLMGFEAIDPDDNLLMVVAMGGSFNNGTVCFTPVEGANEITLMAADSCGAADTCSTTVIVRKNNPPVCQLPPDSSIIHFCPGQDTCLVVTAYDVDGNLQGCSVVSGPGQIVDDTLWCYTPAGNETVTVTIECVDSLGLSCTGSFTVQFNISKKPELGQVDVTDVFLCQAGDTVCIGLDINSFGMPFEISTLVGQYNSNDSSVCIAADTSGAYYNRVILTNSCGQADTIEYVIDVVINSAPVASCPEVDTIEVCYTQEQAYVSGFDFFDVDGNISNVEVIGGNLSGDTVFFYSALGEHELLLNVIDNCGIEDTCAT